MARNQRKKRTWRSFEEARTYVQTLGLKDQQEWQDYCRSGQKPEDIPSNPNITYREHFLGYGDWLGSGTIATNKRVFRSFEDARTFARGLGLTSLQEWQDYCRSGQKPEDIPSNPNVTYREFFLGYSDWLGNGTIATRNRVFRSFKDARAYVRTLGLQNRQEWQNYCHSGQKPEDIPSYPQKVYQEHFQGFADWLGIAKKWSKKSLLAFLEHLQKHIPILTEKELYMIIQQEGVFSLLDNTLGQTSPLLTLQQMAVQAAPESMVQTNDTVPPQHMTVDGQPDLGDDGNAPHIEKVTLASLAAPTNQGQEKRRETNMQLSIDVPSFSFVSKEALHGLDQLSLPVDFHVDIAEYLITNRVNQLWELSTNAGSLAVNAVLAGDGGPFFTAIKQRFYTEQQAVEAIDIPEGWSFRDATGQLAFPNAMQRWTAWQVREKQRVGNWSGTGTGKTLAAILTSRVIKAHLTLIITNHATIESWCRHIHAAYPESVVLTHAHRLSTVLHYGNTPVYLVLNYEQFQQRNRQALVHFLLSFQLDFVVFDEIQLIKQRSAHASNRRSALETLLTQAEENSPSLCVLGLSATPVINNLLEGKKLLELVMGRSFPDIDARHQTANNALKLHRALMQHGFRTRPRSTQRLEINMMPVLRNDLYDLIKHAQNSILHTEQTLLLPKLDAIKDHVHPGTLIYTHYVQGMITPIQQQLHSMGYRVGLYTGNEKTGLDHFLNGEVDVLVGSSPVGTGLDGLQGVCKRIIFLSLPWTGAEFEQIIGRIHRQGSSFDTVDIVIPQVLFSSDGETWSWDQLRMRIIETKQTLSDCVLDGYLPQALSMNKEMLLRTSQQALGQWIERVRQNKEETPKSDALREEMYAASSIS